MNESIHAGHYGTTHHHHGYLPGREIQRLLGPSTNLLSMLEASPLQYCYMGGLEFTTIRVNPTILVSEESEAWEVSMSACQALTFVGLLLEEGSCPSRGTAEELLT
jgi:hypothetical protein